MTGPPLNLQFADIRPQVLQTSGWDQGPDPFDAFMRAYLAAQQSAVERQREERIAAEQQRQVGVQTAAGDALRAFIMQQGGQEQARTSGAVNEMARLAGIGLPPGARLPSVPLQASGVMGQLASIIPQSMPGAAVPGVVENAFPLMQMAEGRRKEAARFMQVERALETIPDPARRNAMRGIVTFAEMGAGLSDEMKQRLWPQLKEIEDAVSAPVMNAAIEFFRTGVPTWGQVRKEMRLPKNAGGLSDDAKFPGGPWQPDKSNTDTRSKASAQLAIMSANAPFLDAYSQKQAPGWLASWLKAGGGRGGSLKEVLANPLLSQQDRQFLTGSRQFADAWVRVISGAQTNEGEFARILNSTIESAGDDSKTRGYKRNMRAIMVQAVADIAAGHKTATSAIDDALRMDWGPQQKAILQEYRKRAQVYEGRLSRGEVSINADDSPTTVENIGGRVTDWASVIDQATGNKPKPGTIGARLEELDALIPQAPQPQQTLRGTKAQQDSAFLRSVLGLTPVPGRP